MKNRNPIARNSWKFNRATAVPGKKQKLASRDWKGSKNRRLREIEEQIPAGRW